jgi:hypothetical protein
MPSIGKVRGDVQHYEERLAAFTLSLGIRLEYSLSILPARGISEGGEITPLPGMPSAEHAAVLAHELAHELLHHQPRRAATTKTVRETEAEAVAYVVVCQSIGLETGTAAADYIQLHRGDAKLLFESLCHIRLAAGRILDGILIDQDLHEASKGQTQRLGWGGGSDAIGAIRIATAVTRPTISASRGHANSRVLEGERG